MAKAKTIQADEPKYRLITYKSDANGRTEQEYATLAEAQTAMRSDYEQELQYCVEHGQQPATAYITQMDAVVYGVRKRQWTIKEL